MPVSRWPEALLLASIICEPSCVHVPGDLEQGFAWFTAECLCRQGSYIVHLAGCRCPPIGSSCPNVGQTPAPLLKRSHTKDFTSRSACPQPPPATKSDARKIVLAVLCHFLVTTCQRHSVTNAVIKDNYLSLYRHQAYRER